MRPPALGYRLRAGISAYGTSNLNTFKLQNQDSKLNARHSESQRDRWQDEYVHSLHITNRGITQQSSKELSFGGQWCTVSTAPGTANTLGMLICVPVLLL